MAVGGVGQNGVNTERISYANSNGGKPKPFNGGTVTVNARAGATQDEIIRDALKKFAFQAGIKDPAARAAFAEKWMSRLGGADLCAGQARQRKRVSPRQSRRSGQYFARSRHARRDHQRSAAAAGRKRRDQHPRSENLADSPEKLAKLREAGFSNADIAGIQKGEVPDGWQVHHKLPLDDGGTIDYSNLVLIKHEPYHKTITNAQCSLVGDLKAGETRTVEFPIPPGNIYPARP